MLVHHIISTGINALMPLQQYISTGNRAMMLLLHIISIGNSTMMLLHLLISTGNGDLLHKNHGGGHDAVQQLLHDPVGKCRDTPSLINCVFLQKSFL